MMMDGACHSKTILNGGVNSQDGGFLGATSLLNSQLSVVRWLSGPEINQFTVTAENSVGWAI